MKRHKCHEDREFIAKPLFDARIIQKFCCYNNIINSGKRSGAFEPAAEACQLKKENVLHVCKVFEIHAF